MRLGYIELHAQRPSNCQIERTYGVNSSQNGRTLWHSQLLNCIPLGNGEVRTQGSCHAVSDLSRYLVRLGTQANLETTQPYHQARKLQVAAFQIKQSFVQMGGDHVQDGLGQSRNRRGMGRNRSRRPQSDIQKEGTDAATC